SSRPHDRGQGPASSSLFTDHPRHFMNGHERIRIALHELDTVESTECCCFLPCRTPRRQSSISHFAPQAPAERTELQRSMCVSALTDRLSSLHHVPLINQTPFRTRLAAV